ncbi:MAG: dipicolinate synthase subunit DpsA, partial [Clostridia bacterium]|nr:dipicolinate synthase subunit DpsA [Clostridia bacterium]
TGGEIIRSSFSSAPIYTNDVLRQMDSRQILLAGRADEQLRSLTSLYNIHFIDYGKREELLIANAIPTVEGALEIAMRETPFTIHGSRSLVLGYGRIGKLLAKSLKDLGAATAVAARKQRDLAWISAQNLKEIPFSKLSEHIGNYDLIFNTIPTMVLDFRMLSEIPESSLIIDLASNPGGIDFDTAKLLKKKVIWALSLPGKVAPHTAGNIIKGTIQNILDELGV